MIMQATVIDVQWNQLLVFDLETRQRVIVHTPEARWFRPGDLVRIWYNGVMTRSIPPQITAQRIDVLPQAVLPPVIVPPIVRPPVLFPPILRPPVACPGCRRPRRRRR